MHCQSGQIFKYKDYMNFFLVIKNSSPSSWSPSTYLATMKLMNIHNMTFYVHRILKNLSTHLTQLKVAQIFTLTLNPPLPRAAERCTVQEVGSKMIRLFLEQMLIWAVWDCP